MTGDGFLRCSQRYVRMNSAVDDVSIHADQIRRLSWIAHESIVRGHGTVGHLVYLVAAYRAHSAQDDAILDVLLLHHLLHAGEQIRLVFEAQNHNAIEVTGDGKNIWNCGRVLLGVVGGIWRAVDDGLRVS